MEKIKTIIANLSKFDLALIIICLIVSLGILGALITLFIKEWRWLVGIGVPVAVDAALIAVLVAKIKKGLKGGTDGRTTN